MEMDGGRARSEREKLSLVPTSDDLPVPRQVDPETLARFREFSEPAKAAARHLISIYARKLVSAASSVKDSVEGDSVSESNVNEAAVNLNRREESGLKKLAGIFGGIFLGTGISNLFGILEDGKFDRNGIILMAVAGILGAFLIAFDLPNLFPRWRRRKATAPPQPFKVKRRPINQVTKGPRT